MKAWIVEKLKRLLEKLDPIDQEMLVLMLILNTANLELAKGDVVKLAPIKGCCGPFELSGNSCPVFEYRVFEKSQMEFVKVRVEVSRPNRIQYISTIESTTAPERNNELIDTTDAHRRPFEILSRNLFSYFPLVRKDM